MKSPIYVSDPKGVTLSHGNNLDLLAVCPAAKGEEKNWYLRSDGKIDYFSGKRLHGKGVGRRLLELGYRLGTDHDPEAVRLAAALQIHEGAELVENATVAQAERLQHRLAGQPCTFVPFDVRQPFGMSRCRRPTG